ncbi:hypothetical protein GCM10008932_17140 [Alkalibacterium iburiense]|uniref:DUF3397 domain-containing protein n=1 Tax=Alkalibacterium iburiense TaxID=290589 RepID=A0ABP3HBG0_9LACT
MDVVNVNTNALDVWGMLFYIIPFIILIFSKRINSQFKMLNLSVKVVDLLIPYMFLYIYILGSIYLGMNTIPYLVIIVSVVAIILATYYAFWTKTLEIYIFLRMWWRYIFLILLAIYIILGLWIGYRIFFV